MNLKLLMGMSSEQVFPCFHFALHDRGQNTFPPTQTHGFNHAEGFHALRGTLSHDPEARAQPEE